MDQHEFDADMNGGPPPEDEGWAINPLAKAFDQLRGNGRPKKKKALPPHEGSPYGDGDEIDEEEEDA